MRTERARAGLAVKGKPKVSEPAGLRCLGEKQEREKLRSFVTYSECEEVCDPPWG